MAIYYENNDGTVTVYPFIPDSNDIDSNKIEVGCMNDKCKHNQQETCRASGVHLVSTYDNEMICNTFEEV